MCHALSGDAHAAGIAKTPPEESTRDGFGAEDRDADGRKRARLVGRDDRPGQGVRHRSLLRRLDESAWRMPRDDGPVVYQSGDRQAVRVGFSGHHRRRYGAHAARISRRDRHPAPCRVAGGSLGGMQAFEWAILYPDQVDAIVAIASTHAIQPQGVAWNAIARNAIMADPAWQGGHYYGTGRKPDAGMGIARMVGHITYLSAKSVGDKFGRRLQFADDIRYTMTEPEFQVENYLRHQAETFVKRFDANTYLYTSRALTYFDLARQYGNGSLEGRASPRVGANAADRVQLGLAVSAGRIRGNRRCAARARQGRRAARHRGAVWARLLPTGGSEADADDSRLPRPPRTQTGDQSSETGRQDPRAIV